MTNKRGRKQDSGSGATPPRDSRAPRTTAPRKPFIVKKDMAEEFQLGGRYGGEEDDGTIISEVRDSNAESQPQEAENGPATDK